MDSYIPKKGDLIYITLDPQAGHEQKGRRPALVVSNTLFNWKTGMAVICSITNTDRGFPFHLPVPSGFEVTGFVMVEQVKSVDFASRKARFISHSPEGLLENVMDLLGPVLNS